MRELLHDLRFAFRSARRAPGFTTLIVLTLAIGIGPTTAMFSIVDSMLLRELPYRDPDSLVVVWRNRNVGDKAPVSGPDFDDFRQMNGSLSDMATSSWAASFNIGDVAQPLRVEGAYVTPNFFSLLGTRPRLGQLPSGAAVGERKTVILSEALWHSTFGGDPAVIGRDVRLNSEKYTIAAVMPAAFAYPAKAELWSPFDLTKDNLGHRAYHQYRVVARLKPGVTVEQAEADLKRVAHRLGEMYPETTRGIGVYLLSMRDDTVGTVRRAIYVLFGAVVFLLLIACSNAANLLLTRAAGRQREFAVRSALGASRTRLARQLLSEGVLLSLTAGALGLVIAHFAIRLVRTLGAAYFPRPELITIEYRVLLFNFAVCIVTGLAFGLAPLASRREAFDDLRTGTRSGTNRGWESRAAREAIVVAIVALSFFLLVGAGLLIQSFMRVRSIDIGFEPKNLLTFRFNMPTTTYADPARRIEFVQQFLARMRSAPGVQGVAAVNLPLENTMSGDIAFPGEGDFVDARRIASFSEVSPGFFSAVGVPLLEGRDFTADDTKHIPAKMEAMERGENVEPPPVLVSTGLAQRFFSGRSPLGERLLVGGDMPAVIVGVVGDVKQKDVTQPTTPTVYMPLGSPLPPRPMNFIVRSTLPPQAVIDQVRTQLRALDPDIPPYRIRTMEEVLGDAVAGSRFQAVLLAIFATVALLLSTIGIYSVVSYNVAQRTREMGIRMATGATGRDLLQLIVGRIVRLTILGIAIGITGALVLTRGVEALLFQVSAVDATHFAAVGLLLLLIAVLASATPARRAAAVDPNACLRYE